MKRFMRTMVMVIATVLTIGSTALADTYSYEDYTRSGTGFQVDHYHGDKVSVLLYEFAQDDVSIAGITCYYRFYCLGGNTFILDENTTEYEGDMTYKFQSIDAQAIDYIDRNPINVWEFSIKPGTYDFKYRGEALDGQWVTLDSNFQPEYDLGYGEEITVEEGDTVRIYIWHQGYVDGDQTNGAGEKDKAFRAEYLPKFQDWAYQNEKNIKEGKVQSAGPEEVISVSVEGEGEGQAASSSSEELGSTDSSESSAIGNGKEQGQGQEIGSSDSGESSAIGNENLVSTMPTASTPEEKKSNVGVIIGGIGALIVLIILGFVIGKKKK